MTGCLIATSSRGTQAMTVISEFGIYNLVFNSKLESAKKFKRWVYGVVKILRQKAELR